MADTRDWGRNRDTWVRILEARTGAGVDEWVARIRKARPASETELRTWLGARGVTGYAQQLLVMETFGYPDFVLATADALIAAQYEDRRHLRPIFDAVVAAAETFGEVTVQARKTYVSLVGPRRTFARLQATTRQRLDLGLRIAGQKPGGRLEASSIHPTMPLRIVLTTPDDLDAEAAAWLQRAYDTNR
jgi:hypothetical protein